MVILKEDNSMYSRQEIITKEEEYVAYIKEHVANVQRAYQELFVSNKELTINSFDYKVLHETIDNLAPIIEAHDSSKYSDEEFYDYRVKFYPTKSEKDRMDSDPEYKMYIEEKFDIAWKHHYQNNDHHTQYWADRPVVNNTQSDYESTKYLQNQDETICRDMSLGAIIHMICDWQAMSWKFNSDIVDWYINDATKEKSFMTDQTKSIVEDLLSTLYNREI